MNNSTKRSYHVGDQFLLKNVRRGVLFKDMVNNFVYKLQKQSRCSEKKVFLKISQERI